MNTDIVCCWLIHSLQQLGPESLCYVPGWGSLGTAAGVGQPSCSTPPSVGTTARWGEVDVFHSALQEEE